MLSHTFDLPRIAPDFKLGQAYSTNTEPLGVAETVQLPIVTPRNALRDLAWAHQINRKEDVTTIVEKTPNLQKAAKEVLSTINQAAIFSQRPEILELLRKAEKVIPKITDLARDLPQFTANNSSDPVEVYTIGEQVKTFGTGDKYEDIYKQADFIVSLNKTELDHEPEISMDLMKIITIDGIQLNATIHPFNDGHKLLDLHVVDGTKLTTLPIFRIELDNSNSIYNIDMEPFADIPIPGGFKFAYPTFLHPIEGKLIINCPATHLNKDDPQIAAAV